jgi:hypothetical protein
MHLMNVAGEMSRELDERKTTLKTRDEGPMQPKRCLLRQAHQITVRPAQSNGFESVRSKEQRASTTKKNFGSIQEAYLEFYGCKNYCIFVSIWYFSRDSAAER